MQSENKFYEFVVTDNTGKEIQLSTYEGKVLLIVNVASECGYTPQYDGLQKLYDTYKGSGFEILAFPCNDFGGQEPGTNEEIQKFCSVNFGVNFSIFDKVKIKDEAKAPLYNWLTSNPNVETGDVKWNFEKFLISGSGEVIARFRSSVKPLSEELVIAVETELAKLN
ncbi:MAG: glutathione peroxidase [Bacteroidetes bacterium]|nr:glutathione peroxidase [Bacteroidota bacterium]MBU1680042.1 glutathione peroxidase [Bacteroidota bacterium]MBU2505627.1 glutathione peroxidase [Bacteroidota bacterium]